MSRYEIHSENGYMLAFGYDLQMKSFFADLRNPDKKFIVEIGLTDGRLIKTPQALCRLVNEDETIRGAGLDVMGTGCEVALQEDMDTAAEPSWTELAGLALTGYSEDEYELVYE